MSKCEACAFMTILYPTWGDPAGGAVLCTLGKWEDCAPPDGDEFSDCPQFRKRAFCQLAADSERGVPLAIGEPEKIDPVIPF